MTPTKILVPTDFSDCAHHATEYALRLGRMLGAQVHLLHRVHLHPLWSVFTEEEKQAYPESKFWERITLREFQKIRDKYPEDEDRLFTHYSHGDLVPLITKYVEDLAIEWVVMGTHGADGFRELIFGSNAQKVVRNLLCPVIVVKNAPVREEIQNILFASDFYGEVEEGFDQICDLAQTVGATLHLTHVTGYPQTQLSHAEMAQILFYAQKARDKGLEVIIHEKMDFSVEHGISTLAKEIRADLLAMVHFPHSLMYRVVLGSVTESIVNHLELPVVSLPATVSEEERAVSTLDE